MCCVRMRYYYYYLYRLYWTDADPSGSRLEVSNLNGTDRNTVYSHQADQGHFFDVAVFQVKLKMPSCRTHTVRTGKRDAATTE